MTAKKSGNAGKIIGSVIGGLAALTMALSAYTIKETEQAVVTFQGKPVRVYVGSFDAGQPDRGRIDTVEQWMDENGYKGVSVDSTIGFMGTGLHFKIPFLESVVKFPDQILEYNSDPELVLTQDKRQLIVDDYTKFYIDNPLCFYLKAGSVNGGIRKLDDIIYSVIRDNIGRQNFNENIRTTNRDVMALDGKLNLVAITYGREKILDDIITQSHDQVENLGMEVIDIRFIGVELPEGNEKAVYDRMISERGRIAAWYTAQGEAESISVKSNADMEAAKIKANAQQQAGQLLGEGESGAAQIYTDASKLDPEFFNFWRTMKAYVTAYAQPGDTVLVITSESDFNQYMFNANK